MEFEKKTPKIFIISGKARSGKGEVSQIIKNYYSNSKSIIISFGHYIKDYAKRASTWDGSEENKPRELLQHLGIELIKNKINDKLFINRILEDIQIFSYFYDIIIINDARLIDEIETLKSEYPNSISIRVNRLNFKSDLTLEESKHKTEIDLDNYDNFDYTIYNSTYDELKEEVINILSEVDL